MFMQFLLLILQVWPPADRPEAMTPDLGSIISALAAKLSATLSAVFGLAEPAVRNSVQPRKPMRSPVIYVPSLYESTLEVRTAGCGAQCETGQDWQLLWMSQRDIQAGHMCLGKNARLSYNSSTRQTRDKDGVHIRPFKFGDTEGIEAVDRQLEGYYPGLTMIDFLTEHHYTKKDLRGAPYDFRKSPFDNRDFSDQLKSLVEDTYSANYNTPVYIIAYSMGSTFALSFLVAQTQAWKDKYIKAFIPIAGEWAGSALPLTQLATGRNNSLGDGVDETFRVLLRSWSSTYSTLPSVSLFPNQVLLSYKGTNYTARDYGAIFELFNISNAKAMYHDAKSLTNVIPHPMVDVYCIYGDGQDTIDGLVYDSKADFPDKPKYTYGQGDSIVLTRSLAACRRWSRERKYRFNYSVIKNASHLSIMTDKRTFELVLQIIQNN